MKRGIAALIGLALAPAAMQALIAFLPQNVAPNALQSALNTRLLLFAFVVSVSAGALCGFAPALHAGHVSLTSSLNERASTAFGSLRLRRTIVTAQMALTLILVIGAGLFVRTLTALISKGPGFDTSSLISFGIDPVRNGYSRRGFAPHPPRFRRDPRSQSTGGSYRAQRVIDRR
jgi:hypothetical protein